MRKICIIVTGIFFTLLFTTCKQFNANIEDYYPCGAAVFLQEDGSCIIKPMSP